MRMHCLTLYDVFGATFEKFAITSVPMSVVGEKAAEIIQVQKPIAKKTERKFHTRRLGVWEISLPIDPLWKLADFTIPSFDDLVEFLAPYKILMRLFRDMYTLAPLNFVVFVLKFFVNDLKTSIILYIDSLIWKMVSDSLSGKPIDTLILGRYLISRVVVAVFTNWLRARCARNNQILRHRVQLFFMEKSMEVNLMLDPVSAEDPDIKGRIGSPGFPGINEIWDAFRTVVNIASSVLAAIAQITIASLLITRHENVSIFFLLCVLQPFIETMRCNDLWGRTYVSICVNEAYERLASLHRFAFGETFRVDRTSDGVAGYIKKEFKKNRKELGDKSIDDTSEEWEVCQFSLVANTLESVTGDFGIFYFALRVIFSSKGLSFSAVATLRELASSLNYMIWSLALDAKTVAEKLVKVRRIYSQWDIQNQMKDGDVSYPRIDDDRNGDSSGMELEFRNVGFKYPGTEKYALREVSFKIKPGQMVVIVGVNGSGKSSTIKLFNRLYDVTEGEILVDGLPISMYKVEELRRAMAILRQDHSPYPLSLRLNVALGCPDREEVDGEDDIQRAIKEGGADEFINKLPNGLDTVLEPVNLATVNFEGEVIEEMNEIVKKKQKETDISGGEKQRLAASRTFMRLNGGGIKFLAADEPTSALDPHGELSLFNHLKEHRGGKTVVFITHRFGHLTKYADLILVLKDGRLVDSGTHDELVSKEGEYKDLHDVQAQAFLPSTVVP